MPDSPVPAPPLVATDAYQVETAGELALGARVIFALRQAALLGVALLVAGLVTERLRPDQALDRGIASTPFLWAIVLWFVVLVFSAVAFAESQTRLLEKTPLAIAAGIGAVVFLLGLITLDDGSFGRRLVYLFATSLGAVMFWWAAVSLVVLMTRRLRD